MKNRILYVLNNENGSPALEQIVAIGAAFGIMCGIYYVGASYYRYIHSVPGSKVGGYTIVAGYQTS